MVQSWHLGREPQEAGGLQAAMHQAAYVQELQGFADVIQRQQAVGILRRLAMAAIGQPCLQMHSYM